MAPLVMRNVCTPDEVLQTTQGRNRFAQSMRRLKLGTWNVRSMVDTKGLVEVASQWADGQRGEERKVDQIVCELERYNVVVGALQETKWFGCEVYEVSDSVVTSGRAAPAKGEPVQGVALVLRDIAMDTWKKGGKQWKTWSSRCVSACLQFAGCDRKLHVMSCYAPTRAASRLDKDKFSMVLDNFIASVSSRESYVILGDFNARVGSRVGGDDVWVRRKDKYLRTG